MLMQWMVRRYMCIAGCCFCVVVQSIDTMISICFVHSNDTFKTNMVTSCNLAYSSLTIAIVIGLFGFLTNH